MEHTIDGINRGRRRLSADLKLRDEVGSGGSEEKICSARSRVGPLKDWDALAYAGHGKGFKALLLRRKVRPLERGE